MDYPVTPAGPPTGIMASKATCGIRKRTWRPRRSAAPWLSSGFSPLDKGRARPYRRTRIHPRSSRVSDLPIEKLEIKGLGGLPLAVHEIGRASCRERVCQYV